MLCALWLVKLRQKILEKSLLRFWKPLWKHFNVVFEMNSSKLGKRTKIKFVWIYYQVKWTRKRIHFCNSILIHFSLCFWIRSKANHCHEGGGSVRIWLHWEVAEYGSDSERNGDCYPIKVSISFPCQVWTFSYFRLIYVAKWLLHGYATIRKVFPKV